MISISVSEFKAKCLSYIEGIKNTKQTIILTKRGVEIAELRPRKLKKTKAKQKRNPKLGHVIFEGDIVSPVFGDEWEMNQ